MARKLTTGFWCDWSNGFDPQWRYVSLANGEVWERHTTDRAVTWRLLTSKVAELREMVAVMRANDWALADGIDADDAAAHDMREDLGAYPDGMLSGGFGLCESDEAAGWRTNGLPAGYDCLGHAPTAYVLDARPTDVVDPKAVHVTATPPMVTESIPAADMLVPVGKGWRDVPELVALGVKPRRFGKLHHRVAYVFATPGRIVVAWKDGYRRGSDGEAEQRIEIMRLDRAARIQHG